MQAPKKRKLNDLPKELPITIFGFMPKTANFAISSKKNYLAELEYFLDAVKNEKASLPRMCAWSRLIRKMDGLMQFESSSFPPYLLDNESSLMSYFVKKLNTLNERDIPTIYLPLLNTMTINWQAVPKNEITEADIQRINKALTHFIRNRVAESTGSSIHLTNADEKAIHCFWQFITKYFHNYNVRLLTERLKEADEKNQFILMDGIRQMAEVVPNKFSEQDQTFIVSMITEQTDLPNVIKSYDERILSYALDAINTFYEQEGLLISLPLQNIVKMLSHRFFKVRESALAFLLVVFNKEPELFDKSSIKGIIEAAMHPSPHIREDVSQIFLFLLKEGAIEYALLNSLLNDYMAATIDSANKKAAALDLILLLKVHAPDSINENHFDFLIESLNQSAMVVRNTAFRNFEKILPFLSNNKILQLIQHFIAGYREDKNNTYLEGLLVIAKIRPDLIKKDFFNELFHALERPYYFNKSTALSILIVLSEKQCQLTENVWQELPHEKIENVQGHLLKIPKVFPRSNVNDYRKLIRLVQSNNIFQTGDFIEALEKQILNERYLHADAKRCFKKELQHESLSLSKRFWCAL